MSNVGSVGNNQPYQPKVDDPPKAAIADIDPKKAATVVLEVWENAAELFVPQPGYGAIPFFVRKLAEGQSAGDAAKETGLHVVEDAKDKIETLELFEGKPGLKEVDKPALAGGTMGVKDKSDVETAKEGAAAFKEKKAAGMTGFDAAMAAGKELKVKG